MRINDENERESVSGLIVISANCCGVNHLARNCERNDFDETTSVQLETSRNFTSEYITTAFWHLIAQPSSDTITISRISLYHQVTTTSTYITYSTLRFRGLVRADVVDKRRFVGDFKVPYITVALWHGLRNQTVRYAQQMTQTIAS